MTKSEILKKLDETHQEFLAAIEGLTEEQLQEPGVNGDWSVKDLLYHMTLWEAELVTLLWQAASGKTPTTVHFKNLEVDKTNARWYKQGIGRSLEKVREDYHGVRKQTKLRLEDSSEEDLNDPQRYSWQRDFPLWEWIASDTFVHEPEHAAQVREWRQGRGY